jgi:hypothetical protein
MRRNIDGIALCCIVLVLLLVHAVSTRADDLVRAVAFQQAWCPRTAMRAAIPAPRMPRVVLPAMDGSDR